MNSADQLQGPLRGGCSNDYFVFYCEECNQTAPTVNLRRDGAVPEVVFECPKCEKTYNYKISG